MEDIVAVEVNLTTDERRYFLTWGRIQDRVDPSALERIVLEGSTGFALGGSPASARLCSSLSAAKKEPFFFECFFQMCQKPIPFGPGYERWRSEMDRLMRMGKELYFLGRDLRPDLPH
jgi:hypothetical protein